MILEKKGDTQSSLLYPDTSVPADYVRVRGNSGSTSRYRDPFGSISMMFVYVMISGLNSKNCTGNVRSLVFLSISRDFRSNGARIIAPRLYKNK